MEKRAHIFNAGPSVLPEEVLLEAQKNLFNYKGKGLSVMEMSHRSADFEDIIGNAKNSAKKLMGLGDDYDILFLGGGASTQFLMVPLNLCPADKTACYVNTGTWGTKAYKEAKKAGKKAIEVASSEADNFTWIPKDYQIPADAAYLHVTTNNTIYGTEMFEIPEVPEGVLLIADMSSDFLSRPMDYTKFDLIYAGAQKNIGPAGVTMVAIRKSIYDRLEQGLPTMLSYKTHIDKDTMFNTPPCWPIYIVSLVLKWMEDMGGLEAVQKHNIQKAKYIYDVIDEGDFYRGTAKKEDRSLMNICFRLPSEDLEKQFIKEAGEAGMIGLKGHRSVGGCRASVYNSLPLPSAEALANFMRDFRQKNS